jgi:hypothetical protein
MEVARKMGGKGLAAELRSSSDTELDGGGRVAVSRDRRREEAA